MAEDVPVPLLEVRDLTVVVGERTLFSGLGLRLETGESVVVVGESGSGKTRLLRALAWLDPIAAGRLRLHGRSPQDWGAPGWRSRVLYCGQRAAVFPGSPADLAAEVASFEVWSGRETGDAEAIARRWGLDADQWRQPWTSLSGGEHQRAALAIAVARRPEVLLLDEPTSALDRRARAAVEAELAGRTAVWVTHDRAQAERVGVRILDLDALADVSQEVS